MNFPIKIPPVIFGTSCLGNIYEATPFETKLAIVRECVKNAIGDIAMFDTAGKYGAGLALESLGKCLKELNVPADRVIISNKLAWYQTELKTAEPTFEPGVWKNLKNDAIQRISYEGIIECFEQGNDLLGDYNSQMVSIHDPDEYLIAATGSVDEESRFHDILEAYRALFELKRQGKVSSVGVGAKNWRSIQRISEYVDLDWVLFANSLTLRSHPKELLDFIKQLVAKNVTVINSALFNGGFLIGRDYYNYAFVDKESEEGKELYEWRDKFFALCETFKILPAEACFNFGARIDGVSSVALSTTKPQSVKKNMEMVSKSIPLEFWDAMIAEGLLENVDFLRQDVNRTSPTI